MVSPDKLLSKTISLKLLKFLYSNGKFNTLSVIELVFPGLYENIFVPLKEELGYVNESSNTTLLTSNP